MNAVATALPGLAAASVHGAALVVSVSLAFLAASVGIDLAGRTRGAPSRHIGALWIFAASLAMGSGVWAMHFVGMSATTYPFAPGFDLLPTLASWCVAAMVCTLPLAVSPARHVRRRLPHWLRGSATATGILCMHLIGLSALATEPGPSYDWRWVATAWVLAAVGCSAGLSLLARADACAEPARSRLQTRAALLLGGALAGLHFLAQAGTTFAPGTICSSRSGLEAPALSGAVGAVTLAFLGLMSLVSALEKRAQRVAAELNASLAQAHEEIRRTRLNDAATGLPNRLVFQERLERAMAQADATGNSLALIRIEVDDFARAARACTPDRVDEMLRACARRIAAAVPACELASGGGHHFLAFSFLSGRPDAAHLVKVDDRFRDQFRTPILDGVSTRLTLSVGVALYPGDGGPTALANNASIALEAAQARGGNGYAFFEAGMDRAAQEATQWLDALRSAGDRGEFELHYQPKMHASSGQVAGVEALIRWRHPHHGVVSPAVFIPLAERFGVINEIGDWVVEEAASQMARWAREGLVMRVAVNLSPVQLLQEELPDKIAGALRRHGVSPALLTCEITESGAMQDSARTMATFRKMQEIGVQLSIDDFGTGYSSLSHLRKIPLSQLKVDRSFVADLATSAESRSIVSAIIVMAHALNLEVVAEGVETSRQRDALVALGCDKLQGFLFARPMPASALTDVLAGIEASARQDQEPLRL